MEDAGGADLISPAEVLRARYRSRLPRTLVELGGPSRGVVDLPLHVVWSGVSSFSLERPKARMSLYRIVLAEGQRQDLIRFLNKDLLLAQWPVLRRLVSRHLREVWEEAFPELAQTAGATG
ncbi:hypothetical protein OHT59_04715 [Streptomyces sp. NBC_00243]|uniref:hypothetical protein n=1 Tax=Streptomyces sp. NBC_00243 TaxID=2975688 RepID=UPI002DD8D215|nr:hypothetical protein [Streptomyces sp. NBC_00243]WRZ25724.1 hypothetical protein OHT59_04715 [Streptomyces sp. NBC_00243]